MFKVSILLVALALATTGCNRVCRITQKRILTPLENIAVYLESDPSAQDLKSKGCPMIKEQLAKILDSEAKLKKLIRKRLEYTSRRFECDSSSYSVLDVGFRPMDPPSGSGPQNGHVGFTPIGDQGGRSAGGGSSGGSSDGGSWDSGGSSGSDYSSGDSSSDSDYSSGSSCYSYRETIALNGNEEAKTFLSRLPQLKSRLNELCTQDPAWSAQQAHIIGMWIQEEMLNVGHKAHQLACPRT